MCGDEYLVPPGLPGEALSKGALRGRPEFRRKYIIQNGTRERAQQVSPKERHHLPVAAPAYWRRSRRYRGTARREKLKIKFKFTKLQIDDSTVQYRFLNSRVRLYIHQFIPSL